MSMPRTLGTSNVMFDSITSNITNTPKELSRTPEMSFSKVSSQPRISPKQSISRISLKKLKSFRNTHSMRHFNKQMDMIWLNTKLINLKSMVNGNFIKKFFTGYYPLYVMNQHDADTKKEVFTK